MMSGSELWCNSKTLQEVLEVCTQLHYRVIILKLYTLNSSGSDGSNEIMFNCLMQNKHNPVKVYSYLPEEKKQQYRDMYIIYR